ncbi:MAG: glutamate--tRNA ligase, partial [Verrucomicrobiota bacterium]
SLEDLPSYVSYFFQDDFGFDAKTASKLSKKGDPKAILAEVLPILESVDGLDAATLQGKLEAHAASKGQKIFAYFPALRFAVSGQPGGPDLLPMLQVMGPERVLGRIQTFLG